MATTNDEILSAVRKYANNVAQMDASHRQAVARTDRRVDDVVGRVAHLEAEGLPSVAIEHLKRIEKRLNDHVDAEDVWMEGVDQKIERLRQAQEDLKDQLIAATQQMTDLATGLAETNMGIVKRTRNASVASGAGASIIVNAIIVIGQLLGIGK